ncbi:MAG: MFS transporter [Candidatus Dormibacteraceae bacterium]
MNLYLHQSGFGNDVIGYVNAMPAVAAILLGLPVASASDRFGRRPFLVGGAMVAGIGAAGIALSTTLVTVLLSALVMGGGTTCIFAIGGAVLGDFSTDEDRVAVFSSNFLLGWMGGFFGSVGGGYLAGAIGGVTGLRSALLVGAVAVGLAAVPALMLPRPERATSLPPGVRSFLGLDVLRFGIPNLALAFGAGAMVRFFNLFFASKFNLGPGAIGTILAASYIVTALGALAAPPLARRVGSIRFLLITVACSIPFLGVITFAPWLVAVIGAFLARQALMNMGEPVFQAFAQGTVPARRRGALNGMLTFSWNIGWFAGPAISGVLQVRGGFQLAFSFTIVCYVVYLGLLWWFWVRPRRADSGLRTGIGPLG